MKSLTTKALIDLLSLELKISIFFCCVNTAILWVWWGPQLFFMWNEVRSYPKSLAVSSRGCQRQVATRGENLLWRTCNFVFLSKDVGWPFEAFTYSNWLTKEQICFEEQADFEYQENLEWNLSIVFAFVHLWTSNLRYPLNIKCKTP